MSTLYELKQSLGTVGEQLKNKSEELSAKAGDPNIPFENVQQLEKEVDTLQKRYDILETRKNDVEAKQLAKAEKDMQKQGANNFVNLSEAEKMVKAKAEFYRHA
ncbi:TPA: phage major capsid protein, partial [Staphylococcus aureus]|nr:phage major capsid protein [Staphylococcus aureus]HDD0305261.1 phage major capsid protein [Staphylococcus aureus]HDD0478593.1 phage major capsid protein [Staphylococcus aureus]HDD0587790.1 phage major capsid protein [Staphylococcus aureus]HDD0707104.1 phage major capsid protein [Staphylococcus aureus]